MKPTSGAGQPASSRIRRTPCRAPSTGLRGVVGTFVVKTVPAVSSMRMTSVKVPPTSMPILFMAVPQRLSWKRFQYHSAVGRRGSITDGKGGAGAADHQFGGELDVTRRPVASPLEAVQEQLCGGLAELGVTPLHDRNRWRR